MRPNIRVPNFIEDTTVDYEGQTVLRWVLVASLLACCALWGLFLWAVWPV